MLSSLESLYISSPLLIIHLHFLEICNSIKHLKLSPNHFYIALWYSLSSVKILHILASVLVLSDLFHYSDFHFWYTENTTLMIVVLWDTETYYSKMNSSSSMLAMLIGLLLLKTLERLCPIEKKISRLWVDWNYLKV